MACLLILGHRARYFWKNVYYCYTATDGIYSIPGFSPPLNIFPGISAFELATKENPYMAMANKAYDILDTIVKKEPPILSTNHPG